MFSTAALLTLSAIVSAVILTMFSATGIETFHGQAVQLKIALFTLQQVAAISVVVDDLMALGVSYFLVYHGITLGQLWHALSHMVSFDKLYGTAYRAFMTAVTAFGYFLGAVVLSVVPVQQEAGVDKYELVGGRNMLSTTIEEGLGENHGMGRQSFLLNAWKEK